MSILVVMDDVRAALAAGFSPREVAYMLDLDDAKAEILARSVERQEAACAKERDGTVDRTEHPK